MTEKIKLPAADQKLMQSIDETDRAILGLLSDNPNISQAELSEHLRISQPAVSLRMRKLEQKGVLTHIVGTDIKKAELFLAKVELSTNNVEGVLKAIERCPLYLNGFLTSGRHNMTFLLIGENVRSIMSCIDSRLRQTLPVRNLEFDLIVTPTKPLVIPLKPRIKKDLLTPCGANCSTCSFYTSERCLGCPASVHYKGKLL